MRVCITAGFHARLSTKNRIEKCDDKLDAPDVLFREHPKERETERHWAIPFVVSPLVMIPIALVTRAYSILPSGDNDIEDHFVEKYDMDVFDIDINHGDNITHAWKFWVFVTLLAFLAPILAFLEPHSAISNQEFSVDLGNYARMIFFTSIMLALGYLASTLMLRDHYFANEILDKAEHYNEAVVIIGGAHRAGVHKRLKSSSKVSIVSD